MNNTEIVPFLEHAAYVISQKSNLGSHGAIEHVLKLANNILKNVDVSNDQYMPLVWIEELKASNFTVDAINKVRENRKTAADEIKELIIWLLEKYPALDLGLLFHEFIFMDLNQSPSYLTPQHVAEYKAKQVSPLDTDMMFWHARMDAFYAALTYTNFTPRQAFDFISSLSYHPMNTLSISFQEHQEIMLAEAKRQAQVDPAISLATVLENIKNNFGGLGLNPRYMLLITTPAFKMELAKAMRNEPPITYRSVLSLYTEHAFDEWLACKHGTYCNFTVLNNKFRNNLKSSNYEHVFPFESTELRRQAFEKLSYYVENRNSQHPVHTLYNLTDTIIARYQEQNATITISAVCQDITRVIIQQQPPRLNSSLNISYALANVPNGYVSLLCERNRMACADQLQNVTSVKTALLLVSRTSLAEVKRLTHMFAGKMLASQMSAARGLGYQQLTDEALAEIMFPVTTYKLDVNLAMELLKSYPPGQTLYQHGAEFASFQQANQALTPCQTHLAKSSFFNGSYLVTQFSNEILLASVATMLTTCMEANARNQLSYVHSEEQSSANATYDPRWLYGFCTLTLTGVILLGINLRVKIKPVSIIQYALNALFFGNSKPANLPEHKSLLSHSVNIQPR